MADFGHVLLVAALLIATFVVIAGPLAVSAGVPVLLISARRGVFAVAALMTGAGLTLLGAFVTHDFSIRYVAEHSSRDMPRSLIVAAFYSGQQGSLLYWAWAFSLFSAFVVWREQVRVRPLMPYLMATLMAVVAFFSFLLGFIASPFDKLAVVPADGLGLNPLLFDYGMLYHPPMLLGGYMSWGVPFAFAVAALATGRLDAEWIQTTRRYALVAWAILGIGNLLGSWWAYRVLGWGGYWGWDPVENSAIMPWLLGTAFIHSIMIQERRGMLKVWNLALILVTFYLCLFGTFVVRSGVISSVHSFAQSAIGPYFLAFVAVVVVGTLGLLVYRLPLLRSDNQLDAALSREAAFILNNLLFVALVFAIFWGTIFPLVSEAVQGVKLTVGPPYFTQVAGPMMIALVVLMGIGPLMPWRRASPSALLNIFVPPVTFALAASGLIAVAVGPGQPVAIAAFGACAFVLGAIVQEFVRGTLARQHATGERLWPAFTGLIRRNNRRYGGYVVHLGIIMIAAAITGSSFYQIERQAKLQPGESVEIGAYRLTFAGLAERRESTFQAFAARLDVQHRGVSEEALSPEKRFHRNFERQPSTEVAIRTTPLEDLYVVLVGWDDSGAASFLIFVNPMVVWLWTGGFVAIAGGLISFWPAVAARSIPVTRSVPGFAVSRAS